MGIPLVAFYGFAFLGAVLFVLAMRVYSIRLDAMSGATFEKFFAAKMRAGGGRTPVSQATPVLWSRCRCRFNRAAPLVAGGGLVPGIGRGSCVFFALGSGMPSYGIEITEQYYGRA